MCANMCVYLLVLVAMSVCGCWDLCVYVFVLGVVRCGGQATAKWEIAKTATCKRSIKHCHTECASEKETEREREREEKSETNTDHLFHPNGAGQTGTYSNTGAGQGKKKKRIQK